MFRKVGGKHSSKKSTANAAGEDFAATSEKIKGTTLSPAHWKWEETVITF
jgi:hypothetical protein